MSLEHEIAEAMGESLFDSIAADALADVDAAFAAKGVPLTGALRKLAEGSIAAGVGHALKALQELQVLPGSPEAWR